MSLTLANQARTSLLTFIHNESLNTLKNRPDIKINGRSPLEMLRNFENIEITINNPIETGFASRSGRMKSSYRYLNDIIIHSEEEEVDESFIEDENIFIMKQKTIVSEKKINNKDHSLNNNNNNNVQSHKRTKYHKSNSLSDSGEISSNKNVDYIKHSYSLLRKLANFLKKGKACKNNNSNNSNNCGNKKTNKHSNNESFSSRHNNTTKDKNNLFHNNNNNNNFSPNSNRSCGIKENDFHINLHKFSIDNNKLNSINNSQINQSISFSETCDSSICQQPKSRRTKHKHTSNTNVNSSIKTRPPPYSNRKSFVGCPTSFHAKIFAESS